MRISWLGTLASAAVTSACLRSVPPAPGEPAARLSPQWIQGEPTQVVFTWPNATECGQDDWTCAPPVPPLTVLHVTCHGCDVIDDPTGTSTPNWAVVTAVATTDGPITIDAMLRFDGTGDQRQVSASTTGDHEVALDAQCKLVDTSTLTPSKLLQAVPVELFHACGPTRLASETAVLFPVIRTFNGDARFPFCMSGVPCTTYYGSQLRSISSLSITPAPTTWARTTADGISEFAVLPPTTAGQTVSVGTPLAGGAISTTYVEIPPIR